MRLLNHDNTNRFLGLSTDSRQILSVWRFCTRGALSVKIKN